MDIRVNWRQDKRIYDRYCVSACLRQRVKCNHLRKSNVEFSKKIGNVVSKGDWVSGPILFLFNVILVFVYSSLPQVLLCASIVMF